MYAAQTQDYETEYSEAEVEILDLAESDARRRDLIALHVAGRKEFGKNWDTVRPMLILAATQYRTQSARECDRDDLTTALYLLERTIANKPAPEPLVSANGFGSNAEARRRDAEPTPAYMYMDDAAAGISSW